MPLRPKRPAPTPSACRLYVILAREAPVAAVFRRGPSTRVQILKWSTDTDAFEEGQWFHGRIYERRCDLSPDGSRLVSFAQKIDARTMESDSTSAWTAVSRLPFLTALALWPKGDCWNGGGLFESSRHLLLNHLPFEAAHHPDHPPPRGLRVTPGRFAPGEDHSIWSARTARDGWSLVQEGQYRWKGGRPRTERAEIWERALQRSNVTLVRSLEELDSKAAGGPSVLSYRLRRNDRPDLPIPGAQWADWDQQGRLVFARGGCLFTATFDGDRLQETLLIDLNGNKPKTVETPKWATRW